MTLSEIRNEQRNTRLKTKRWHELTKMHQDRVAKINRENGGENSGTHDAQYHHAQAKLSRIELEGKTLKSYVNRGKHRKAVEHHERLANLLEE